MADAPSAYPLALHPPGNPREGSAHLLRYRDAPSVVIWWWRNGKWSGNSEPGRDKRDTTYSPAAMAARGWTYIARAREVLRG
jgi:hypothetical protein